MSISRRTFLRNVSASSLVAPGMGGALGLAMNSMQARAADVSGYKALVCVFLLGGLDNWDTFFPFDLAEYNELAGIRSALFGDYAALPGGSSRDRARLLQLSGNVGGRTFALPEDMPDIHAMYEAGNAALVGNVGPLIEPLTIQQFEDGTAEAPTRLFSHNDQQSTWQSFQPEGAPFGWGGLIADAAISSGTSAEFTAITTLNDGLFLTGQQAVPYNASGANTIGLLDAFQGATGEPGGLEAFNALRDHFIANDFARTNFIETDIADAMRRSVETNEQFADAIENTTAITTPFPTSGIGRQLQTIANAIAVRGVLGVSRQIFFVGFGNFDTHGGQAGQLPARQRELNDSVKSFFDAMTEIGLTNEVTLFTASDFGRTLAINGDGTDHGWGGHQIVAGGAVNGGAFYGDFPEAAFGTPFDVGNGRLLATTSVEQYAAPLASWFGLTDPEIATALPNLSSFPANTVPFI